MDTMTATYERKREGHELDRALGQAFAKLRIEARMSQYDVARALGCNQALVSKIEIGQRAIKLCEIPMLARSIGISPEELQQALLDAITRT